MTAAEISCRALDRRQWLSRALRGLGLGLGAGAALVACSRPDTPLRVGSVVFPGYEWMFLARELGLLDESRVRLIELQNNTDTLRALAAGQLEAAALTLDEMWVARNDGIALRAVLIMDISVGANAAMAHAPVTLQTLDGRRVGVDDSAAGRVMLAALLRAAGLNSTQIQVVPVRLDRTEEAFRLGAVDVVITAEPWALRLERKGARRIFDSAAIPDRMVDVLAVRPEALERHGSALRYLLMAHFAAQGMWRTEPQIASQWMAPRLQVPPEEVASMYRGLHMPTAAQNQVLMQEGQLRVDPELVPPGTVWTDWIDARFLPK